MTYTYIKFDNQTMGEKARKILSDNHIRAYLKRNPNPDHKQGCNYALFCDGSIWTAHAIIEKHSIRNLGVEFYRDRL